MNRVMIQCSIIDDTRSDLKVQDKALKSAPKIRSRRPTWQEVIADQHAEQDQVIDDSLHIEMMQASSL